MPSFPVEGLTRASARILEAADVPPDIAAKVAGWLADANLSGHPSHGFIRVPMYAERIRQGLWIPDERPEVTQESDTSVLIDGRAGFGFLAAELLTRKLAEKAKAQHVAVGGIIRCTHIGRLGLWGEMAVEMGVAYLMGTGRADSTQGVPFGGREARLSTNPLMFAMPGAGGDGMVMDFATMSVAEGKLYVARDKGAPLPEGWIVDRDGHPSTDPNDYFDGGSLLPFGGHKGYALAVMVALLSSSLVGARAPGVKFAMPVFGVAIDPGTFNPADAVAESVGASLERLRATPPAEGFREVLVPGDLERRSREAARTRPVEIADETWQQFRNAAESWNLDPSEIESLARGH